MDEIKNIIPWVEKYRPTNFEDIVMDPLNKIIMTNIIDKNYFPNLLFYGPPGTGKTTTIINLIYKYQKKYNQQNKSLIIHLNASDERGIDIIRNQISQFVNSNTLFTKGTKFVILDEVDYMTKNAQQALKLLLHGYNNNVRFCLICNYISRIDESLQNEFMRLRFNQLPEENILEFLLCISNRENLNLSRKTLKSIQQLYSSDIRSMVNYMQSNQNMIHNKNVIDNTVWVELTNKLLTKNINEINLHIESISREYNIEMKNLIKDYINYIIRNVPNKVNNKLLIFVEFIMHIDTANIEYLKIYSIVSLKELLK